MAEMLLINPRKRRAGAKRRSTARKTVARKSPAKRRRANPISVASVKKAVRRRIRPSGVKSSRRRRRNPIAGFNMKSIVDMFQTAAIGGAGAVGIDALMAQANKFLPASLKTPNANMAVKALLSVVVGKGLSKATKGMSEKMAIGALTVQAAALVRRVVPASVPLAGVGYNNPAAVSRGSARIGPVIRAGGTGAYNRAGGATPMLNAYTGGGSPLIRSGGQSMARMREGSSR